jgi:2-phospho-L-lactate guanylyltransferase (CobY/MobA/RfbA family)
MPAPWLKRIRKTGQLTVFNKASGWTVPVETAVKSFNNLALGVQFVAEATEKAANVVLVLANGPGVKYKYYGDTVETKQDFVADRLHGQTSTLADQKEPKEIFFAVIFLPGKLAKATKSQKEMVVVHEFIHACGLNDWHDTVGLMFPDMQEQGGGLLEYIPVPQLCGGYHKQLICQTR